MRQPLKKTISGKTLTFNFLKPSRAIALMTKLAKLGLPAIGAALTKGKASEILDTDIASLGIDGALALLADRLDEGPVLEIVGELMATVEEGSSTLDWEAAFEGDLKGLFEALKFALEVNYKDFFSDLFGKGK